MIEKKEEESSPKNPIEVLQQQQSLARVNTPEKDHRPTALRNQRKDIYYVKKSNSQTALLASTETYQTNWEVLASKSIDSSNRFDLIFFFLLDVKKVEMNLLIG